MSDRTATSLVQSQSSQFNHWKYVNHHQTQETIDHPTIQQLTHMPSTLKIIHTVLPRVERMKNKNKKKMSNNIIAAIIESIKKCTSSNQTRRCRRYESHTLNPYYRLRARISMLMFSEFIYISFFVVLIKALYRCGGVYVEKKNMEACSAIGNNVCLYST